MHISRGLASIVASLVAISLWIATGAAQDRSVVVTRNVNLRPEPRSDVDAIELLTPPTSLTLLGPDKTSGYYHVRDSAGHEGWVWASNVKPAEPAAVTGHDAAATELSPDWEKPPIVTSTWQGDEGDCGPDGNSKNDGTTDHRKNRADSPTTYHRVAFSALTRAKLPYPDAPDHRDAPNGWTPEQLAQIAPFEGEAVSVEGYIFVVRKELSGEATNCGFHHLPNTDVHMALTENFGQLEPTAVVVEMTPRIRKDHPNFSYAMLHSCCEGTNVLMRISGYTMLDPFHISDVGKRRQTLWEIHPITRIEMFTNGQWIDLDSQQ